MVLFSEMFAIDDNDPEEVDGADVDEVEDEVMVDDNEFEVDDEVEENADVDENAEHEFEQSFELGSNQCDPIGPPEPVRRTANMMVMVLTEVIFFSVRLIFLNLK